MISYLNALSIVRNSANGFALCQETVPLLESLGRVLAADVIADINLPPFNNAAMDGIAISYSSERRYWKLQGEISAGHYMEISSLREDEAVQIMTGAKLPSQFDPIIPIEDLQIKGVGSSLAVDFRQIKKGQHIRQQGEDLAKGHKALSAHCKISAAQIPILATCGLDFVPVFRKLKIAILSTGDELVDIDKIPTGDQIRVSNLSSLSALVSSIGHTSINYGVARDALDAPTGVLSKMSKILESDVDIVLLTGGVSMGKFDYVREAMDLLGVQSHFWQSMIRPGKPLTFGTHESARGRKFVFGLPGNPVSCFVNFYTYVVALIDSITGVDDSVKRVRAKLVNDVRKRDNKRHFMRAKYFVDPENGESKVLVLSEQTSGNLYGLGQANCLAVILEDVLNPSAGEVLECILI